MAAKKNQKLSPRLLKVSLPREVSSCRPGDVDGSNLQPQHGAEGGTVGSDSLVAPGLPREAGFTTAWRRVFINDSVWNVTLKRALLKVGGLLLMRRGRDVTMAIFRQTPVNFLRHKSFLLK